MWSTCSIETGHSCTQAPHVTQSQTTSSVTAFGTSGERSPPGESRRPLREQLIADSHDQELRAERLPRRVGGADVLAAAAFGARHGVEHLLPRQVGNRARTEPERRLLLGLEVEWLEPTAGLCAAEEDVDRGGGDVQVLRVREVGEEAEDDQHVRPNEDALEDLGCRAVSEQAGDRVGDGRPRGGPGIQPESDQRRMPQEQGRHDPHDQREDEIRLAQMAAGEAPRPLHLPDPKRRRDAGKHEHDEDVDHECVPALAFEPAERGSGRERRLAVDDAHDRHEDRREEDEEAPEDEGVHQPRHEPLEQFALTEDDRRLIANPSRQVRGPCHRLPQPDEPGQQQCAPREERTCDRDRGDQGDR